MRWGPGRPGMLVLGLLFSFGSLQGGHKERLKNLAFTTGGSTGLLTLPVADTLRAGEFGLTLSGLSFHREPGDLDLTLFPIAFTLGVSDRVEFFLSWEASRRVHASAIEESGRSGLHPSRVRTGRVAFFNDTPFLNTGFGSGSGEMRAGFKFNLLSERRGNGMGLALAPQVKLPLSQSRSRLARGLTNGSVETGFDVIVSKDLGAAALVTASAGLHFVDDTAALQLQDRIDYGVGLEMGLGRAGFQLIGELSGSTFAGRRTGLANPRAPLDLRLGWRALKGSRWSLSLAYTASLRHIDPQLWGIPASGTDGWLAQFSLYRRVNRAPTIRCQPATLVLSDRDTGVITAFITDPDDDFLVLTWSTSGGRISRQGTRAIFDGRGLAAGLYQVRAEISDGRHTDSCTVQVRVERDPGQAQPPAGQD